MAAQLKPAKSSVEKKSLADLSEILLHLVFSCLDSASLVSCQAVCRLLGVAAKRDELWRAKCLEDWGESRRVLPENRSHESIPTFLEAWRGWRRSFDGYQAEDVKRVAVWWAGIEKWMTANLKGVMSSLNEGVSEADLNLAEERLGWTLPTHLRLLYRFHNGQWLPFDDNLNESLGVDESRPSVLPKIKGSGMSLGLLGGYCFYQSMMSSKLFSLERGVQGGLVTAESFEGQHQSYFKAYARQWGTDLDTIRQRGGFLISASHDMTKRAWVGSDGNVRFDAKDAALWGVFDAAPVVPSENASADVSDSNLAGRGRVEGNLMTWLEEYLRRLQRGHYGVRARWQEQEPYVNMDDGSGVSGGALRRRPGVWLFPQDGGEYCVTEVTKGVQIQVAPVFVPEAGSEPADMLWAYSVRMQLLRDHPTRPKSMLSCQLSTRHWEINGQEGFHREVTGNGVIGKYPLLKLTPSAAAGEGRGACSSGGRSTTFEYESCTTLEKPPGTMGGHFTFTPGSLSAPTGPSFEVKVPTMDIVRPDFIF